MNMRSLSKGLFCALLLHTAGSGHTLVHGLLEQMKENIITFNELQNNPTYLESRCRNFLPGLSKEKAQQEFQEAYKMAYQLTYDQRLLSEQFYGPHKKQAAAFDVASQFSKCALALRGHKPTWSIDRAQFLHPIGP